MKIADLAKKSYCSTAHRKIKVVPEYWKKPADVMWRRQKGTEVWDSEDGSVIFL